MCSRTALAVAPSASLLTSVRNLGLAKITDVSTTSVRLNEYAARASTRRHEQAVVVRHPEVQVHRIIRLEEALYIAIVERLDANDLRTRRQSRDLKVSLRIHREPANQLAGVRIERHDVRAEDAAA